MPEIITDPVLLLVAAALAYLLGSVPFGLVFARLFGLGDLRQIGSGNIGATNVLRTGSKPAAFLTLVMDAGKGGIAVLLARFIIGAEDATQIAGLFAFLGHIFPVYLGFRGGKGVATYLGTVIALAWPLGLIACAIWAVTALIFRISSLSALVATGLLPIVAVVLGPTSLFLLLIVLAQLVFLRHRSNIRRLMAREEPKIGQNKRKA